MFVLLGGVLAAGDALAQALTRDGIDGPDVIEPTGDALAGKAIAGQCRTCHGIDGLARIPNAPNIAGEPEAYLRGALAAYREGTRVHEMMTIVARALTDAQIADLSAWYAAHPIIAKPSAGMPEAAEICASCHGKDGIALVAGTPNLAGDSPIFLQEQLAAFRSGERFNELMSPLAAELSDADIRMLADWYGSIEITAQPPK